MRIDNFLTNRRSMRDFKLKNLNPGVLDEIREVTKELEAEMGDGSFELRLYENGEHIYNSLDGFAGYSGVMIKSPHYIAIDMKKNNDKSTIYSAYYMEKLTTKLINLGLDTCWITVRNVDSNKLKETLGESISEVNYVLAFGYPKRGYPLVKYPFSERIGVEEMVFHKSLGKKTTMDYLDQRGLGDTFYYVRFAPSTKNLQPWRYVLTEDKVQLLIKYDKDEKPCLTDGGIAMYYFEELEAHQGREGQWKLIDGYTEIEDTNYKYIAEYQL